MSQIYSLHYFYYAILIYSDIITQAVGLHKFYIFKKYELKNSNLRKQKKVLTID